MSGTVVAFNAHPDDEALLAGGTLAALACRGHRVVLVTATDGAAGVAAPEHLQAGLGEVRMGELRASALALGAARVVPLGYADSGREPGVTVKRAHDIPGSPLPLTSVEPAEVTDRLVRILREEQAELLVSCDAAGGYGHPDHRVVHRVARAAARQARTARLLEATAPRESLLRALRLLDRVHTYSNGFHPQDWAEAFSPVADITHRLDVQPWIHYKRAALRAHVSQSTPALGGDSRALATTLRWPTPVFAALLGHEYFVDPAAAPTRRPRTDLLTGLS